MKFDIKVKEIAEKGGANVVISGKQFLLAWDKVPHDISGENRKRREVTLNALKARVFVELIKQKHEIFPGMETDQKVVFNKQYLPDWQQLRKEVEFTVKND